MISVPVLLQNELHELPVLQNEVHVLFHCQDLFVCFLRRKYFFLFFPSSANLFLWRPLILHMSCLVRLTLIFFLNGTINCHFISDIMDY